MKKSFCCFCKKQVLGLPGYDTFLDTFYLLEEDEDTQALDNGIFGDAHAACLRNSAWQEFWFDRHLYNLENIRRMPVICISENIAAA